jgi:hypothetical protein
LSITSEEDATAKTARSFLMRFALTSLNNIHH